MLTYLNKWVVLFSLSSLVIADCCKFRLARSLLFILVENLFEFPDGDTDGATETSIKN